MTMSARITGSSAFPVQKHFANESPLQFWKHLPCVPQVQLDPGQASDGYT
ncbi:MAG: hypothetical protein JWM63_5293 [Gammaproteobacteria bacterium]|nr:hypothetical protein [Gammaproteobacteria bacterium]